jgi:hypothetical protein
MLDEPDPAPPRAGSGAPQDEAWAEHGPDEIRLALVLAYMFHPDPQVRVTAVHRGLDHCVDTMGFQDALVDLSADPDPVVQAAAVRALWSAQQESNCEHAVKSFRDEIRGHSSGFGEPTTEGLRIGGERARVALDLLVEHAPDDAARQAVRTLIDEHVVMPERVPSVSTDEVVFVEETYRNIDGKRATYRVYRAPGRDEAIAFLNVNPIKKKLFYLEVETAAGTYGRDIKGIYQL